MYLQFSIKVFDVVSYKYFYWDFLGQIFAAPRLLCTNIVLAWDGQLAILNLSHSKMKFSKRFEKIRHLFLWYFAAKYAEFLKYQIFINLPYFPSFGQTAICVVSYLAKTTCPSNVFIRLGFIFRVFPIVKYIAIYTSKALMFIVM